MKIEWFGLSWKGEGGKIGFACVYAPNIPTDRRHM